MTVALLSVSSHAIRQMPSPASLHLRVPDGFVIERVAGPELLSFPMFGVQDDRGRLFVFESTEPNTMTTEEMLAKPSYHIRVLEDEDGDGAYDRSTIYADKLPFPKAGAFVDGSLLVSAAPHLLRLKDTTGDLVADERETVLTGGQAAGGDRPRTDRTARSGAGAAEGVAAARRSLRRARGHPCVDGVA